MILHRRYKWLPLAFRGALSNPLLTTLIFAVIIILTFALTVILTQDLQIFPGAASGLIEQVTRDPESIPGGVESLRVTTVDNQSLEVWRLPVPDSSRVAVVFHGNAGDVANFLPYQRYFEELGVTSYGFDYRGYGTSTGWPSEDGLYRDAEAVIDDALRRESVSRDKLILTGISIGTGPAAYAAAKYQPKVALLITPFTTLPDVVGPIPFFGLFRPFTWHTFPVKQFIASLSDTCVVVAHGKADTVIPFDLGRQVYQAARHRYAKFVTSPTAGHNDIFFQSVSEITAAINGSSG
jgi:fermentation-respiration switch protein FrsA (DUF1100 family)